jgi:hypothetical protein
MIVIRNKILPPSGIKALTAWPLLFVRAKYMTERDERHEGIHGEQQKEMLCVGAILGAMCWVLGAGWWSLLALPLYLWVYCGLYITGLLMGRNWRGGLSAYRWNPMEREAYQFEGDTDYLNRRRRFAWYLFLKL